MLKNLTANTAITARNASPARMLPVAFVILAVILAVILLGASIAFAQQRPAAASGSTNRSAQQSDATTVFRSARDLITDMGRFCFECSPRQHPIVGAAADPTGKTVAITWTSTMSGGDGNDDVWLLYSTDGGMTWTKPLRVNDNTTASRQIQSWVAVDACKRVHVAWTDLRNNKNEVWYARSADPTKGFEKNLQVTDGSGAATAGFLGDYKGMAVLGSDVLIVWQDTRRDGGDIYFSRAVGAGG